MASVDSRDYVLTSSTPRVCWAAFNPVNTQNICIPFVQCWTNVEDVGPTLYKSMLYKCFVLAGNSRWSGIAYCWRRLQADTDPMYGKCWASVAGAGQYPFSPNQYFELPVPVCWRYGHDALNQSWVIVGPQSVTLAHIQRDTVTQYWANVYSAS